MKAISKKSKKQVSKAKKTITKRTKRSLTNGLPKPRVRVPKLTPERLSKYCLEQFTGIEATIQEIQKQPPLIAEALEATNGRIRKLEAAVGLDGDDDDIPFQTSVEVDSLRQQLDDVLTFPGVRGWVADRCRARLEASSRQQRQERQERQARQNLG
jgi:hypothetical protein